MTKTWYFSDEEPEDDRLDYDDESWLDAYINEDDEDPDWEDY